MGKEKEKLAKKRVLATLLDAVKEGSTQQNEQDEPNPPKLVSSLIQRNTGGAGVLHCAAQCQSLTTLEVILESLHDLQTSDQQVVLSAGHDISGKTALHISAENTGEYRLAAVQALLDAKAYTNVLDHHGSMPLHLAAKTGAPSEVLKLLLHKEADGVQSMGIEDTDGRTPLEWSMASSLTSIMRGGSSSTDDPRKRSGNPEALAILAQAETGGRHVVNAASVRDYASRATEATSEAPGFLFTRSW